MTRSEVDNDNDELANWRARLDEMDLFLTAVDAELCGEVVEYRKTLRRDPRRCLPSRRRKVRA